MTERASWPRLVALLIGGPAGADTVADVGLNPELGDRSPAEALAEDPAGVLQAARAFLAHG